MHANRVANYTRIKLYTFNFLLYTMKSPIISIIAAVAQNRAIGKNNRLLWNIPEDLQHFKKITMGHPIIMGQRTFESLKAPLSNRANIVLTQDKNYHPGGVKTASSIDEAIGIASGIDKKEIFFIGGGMVYKQAIKFANKLYLTEVEGKYGADTFFPEYNDFKIIKKSKWHRSGKYKYRFLELIR